MSTNTILDAISMLVREQTTEGGRRPLIGVTAGTTLLETGAWTGHEATVLNKAYTDALRAAGARPVILTPQDEWSDAELAELDAIVITGGTDLDPATYGATPLPTDFDADLERDAFEIALVRAAERLSLPLLGICRGLQIINVALGGTLIQHLDDSECGVGYPNTARGLTEVEVQIEADSDLGFALGTGAFVNAYHHQAVDRLADGFRVVARHESGVVHALENVDLSRGFIQGVQFHPEVTENVSGIFETLVTQAKVNARIQRLIGALGAHTLR